MFVFIFMLQETITTKGYRNQLTYTNAQIQPTKWGVCMSANIYMAKEAKIKTRSHIQMRVYVLRVHKTMR